MYKIFIFIFISTYSNICRPCDFTIINGVRLISSDCSLLIATKTNVYDILFFQIAYLLKKDIAMQEIISIGGKVDFPVAVHLYDGGYRLLIGPIKQKDLNSLTNKVMSMGYSKGIMKSLNSRTIKKPLYKKLTSTMVQQKWIEFGYVNHRLAVIQKDEAGRLLSYSVSEFKDVCKALGISAEIATYEEYLAILSSLPVAEKLGLKYRFWLVNQKTITRVLGGVVLQGSTDLNESRPLICMVS